MGLSHAAIAPYDAYPTADGEVLIGIQNDRGWRTLVTEVFGRPDLVDDPRFRTNIQRVENRAECDAEVAAHTRAWTTVDLDAWPWSVSQPRGSTAFAVSWSTRS